MAFRTVGNGNIKGIWKASVSGDSVQGVYTGSLSLGEFSVYTARLTNACHVTDKDGARIVCKPGDVIGVSQYGGLSGPMVQVSVGDEVRITCTGKAKAKRGECFTFDVEVDDHSDGRGGEPALDEFGDPI